ncbi:hypothetical protein [Aquabacterium sp.]|uniref:hypothetical protein n=1 Tax=Aquabacterium sp. TaxID=1872578 RepID=UPI0035C735DC
MSRRALHVAQILWPAFLMAGVLEMVVFSVLDPAQLHFGAWVPPSQAVYSLAFLVFWGVLALSGALSHFMMRDDAHGSRHALAQGLVARRHRRQARHDAGLAHHRTSPQH